MREGRQDLPFTGEPFSSFFLPSFLDFRILNFFLSGLRVGSADGEADSSLTAPLLCPDTTCGRAHGTQLLGQESVPEFCCCAVPIAGGQVWFPPGRSRVPVGKAGILGAHTDARSPPCSREDPLISPPAIHGESHLHLLLPPHCKKSSPYLLSILPSSLLLPWHGRSRDKPDILQEPNKMVAAPSSSDLSGLGANSKQPNYIPPAPLDCAGSESAPATSMQINLHEMERATAAVATNLCLGRQVVTWVSIFVLKKRQS